MDTKQRVQELATKQRRLASLRRVEDWAGMITDPDESDSLMTTPPNSD